MKKLIIIILVIAVGIGAGAYFKIKSEMRTNLALNSKVSGMIDKAHSVAAPVIDALEKIKKAGDDKIASLKNIVTGEVPDNTAKDSGSAISLCLKHGGVIRGVLLKKTKDEYILSCKGEKFTVMASQVAGIKQDTQKNIEWGYKNDIVVRKNNGVICDGKIIKVTPEDITLSLDDGGGVEMIIPRKDIDELIFAPVCNKETAETEENLAKLYPKMTVYKEGNITLFTDSYVKKAKAFKKMLSSAYTEIYLRFFPLFKDRKPLYQNFVVVFDDIITYIESTGAPPYYLGFFDPSEKVLYLYDEFGNRIEIMLFEMLTEATGYIDKEVDKYKKIHGIDNRYDDFIDGQTKEFKDRFWKAINLYKATYSEDTRRTLRHELTHEIFHNWGFQNVIISRPKMDKDRLTAKKKEFIEAKDWEKKRKLLDEMMKMERPKEINMAVAQSWLAEGLATYCGTEPIGSVDNSWLFLFQDALTKNKLNPIEFLTNFEKGSFVGMVSEAVLASYAQSWLFTSFLMAKYYDQFIEYQKKMAEPKNAGRDNLALLLLCLKKDLPTLENEFLEYAKTYPRAEDPSVKRYVENYSVWADLLSSHF